MTTPDSAPRTAGVFYLAIIVLGLTAELALRTQFVRPDAATTAQLVAANGLALPLAIVCDTLMIVADVIPNPPLTRLVRESREKGCRVIDGLGMLVAQGVIGIEFWTGESPDPAVMRAGLEEVFG